MANQPNPESRIADRPPRIQPELPQGVIPIPQPPEEQKAGFSIRQAMLPLLTIIGYVIISLAGQGRNLLFIVPMAMSVVFSSVFTFLNYRDEKRKEQQKKRDYDMLLAELRREMVASHDRQRSFYKYNYPDVQTSLSIDGQKADSRSGTRLWERRSGDQDFGIVRLGIGARPSTVVYEVERGSNEEDQQMKDAIKLDEDSRVVFDVPITIPLYQRWDVDPKDVTNPVRNAIGVAGKREDVYPFIRAIIAHVTTFHAPTEANLFVVGINQAQKAWDWVYDVKDQSTARTREDLDSRAARPLVPHFVMPKLSRDGINYPICFEREEGKAPLRENDPIAKFWKQLRRELENRAYRLREDKERGFNNIPLMVVIVDMLEPVDVGDPGSWLKNSTLKDVEAEAAVGMIMSQGLQLGASLIFLTPERRKVPSGCTAIIEVEPDPDPMPHTPNPRVFRYAEVGLNTPRFIGVADVVRAVPTKEMRDPEVAALKQLSEYAQRLKQWLIRQSYGEDIPDAVTLLELNNARNIEDIDIPERWYDTHIATKPTDENPQIPNADWTRVAIGRMSNEEIRRLYFKSDADGVHGMIAGATGSGKSELLMSLILGLAISYDPSIINFVLIDYKGGGAFDPLRGLPHVVDVVTNLQQSAVDRMFKAITAELMRRQEINTITNSKHIVDYRQRGLHLLDPKVYEERFKREKQPYPHLFVIIDEFAEMMEGDNDYKEQLNRITRLGRALGVHLFLAAQRPTGVTDQMRSNIQLRICLRVATPVESSELLRRPDAAFLPNGIPGRGYVQVGQDSMELVQMAWSGAKYQEPVRAGQQQRDDAYWQKQAQRDVIWLNRLGSDQEPRALFEVLVDYMAALSREQIAQGVSEKQRKPWPSPLANYLPLASAFPEGGSYLLQDDRRVLEGQASYLAKAYERAHASGKTGDLTVNVPPLPIHPALAHWMGYTPVEGQMPYLWGGVDWGDNTMRPLIGIIDDAASAVQRLLFARLRQGNVAIFGAPGWGKSTFLRTTIISLAATHSPAELHIYVLDFGSQALTILEKLPHVGAVITADETERIERLLRRLDDIIEERVRLFRQESVNDLYSYNRQHRDQPIPAILVAVDNIVEVKETMDNLLPAFVSLAREGGRAGVHMIATGEGSSSFGKLFNLFTERMTLRLADATEYMSIVGRGVRYIDEIPGRGAVAIERTPMDLQIGVAVAPTDADRSAGRDETAVLRDFVDKMHNAWEKANQPRELLPPRVQRLPNFVTFAECLNIEEGEGAEGDINEKQIAFVGIDDATLKNALVDFQRIQHFLIAGQQQTGKTNAMRAMILSLGMFNNPNDVAMVLIDRQNTLFYYAGGSRSFLDLPHVIASVTEPEEMKGVLRHLRYEFDEMPVEDKLSKRHLFVFIDNYDDFEELGVKPADLAPLTRFKLGRPLIHFVVSGSDIKLKSQDDLTRRISRSGLAMENKTAQATPFNATIRKSLREAELPLARAFLISSGQSRMVQVANLSSATEPPEKVLDRHIFTAMRKYKNEKAEWAEIVEKAGEAAATSDQPRYSEAQMQWIREELAKQIGISVGALEGIAEEDVLQDAYKQGVLARVPTSEELANGGGGTNGAPKA